MNHLHKNKGHWTYIDEVMREESFFITYNLFSLKIHFRAKVRTR